MSIIVFTGLFLAASCGLSDLFSEYREVNLIEGYGFDSESWVPDQTADYYMNFETPSESAALNTSGLPEGASVMRLEIPNLMPNGDFEDTSGGDQEAGVDGFQPEGWEGAGGAFSDIIPYFYYKVVSSSSYLITNNTFYFNNQTDKAYSFRYNLSANLEDGFIENKTYSVRFEFRANNVTLYQYNDGTSNTQDTWYVETGSLSSIRDFPLPELDPLFTAYDSGNWYFTIGTLEADYQTLQQGYLDNVRIIRADIDQCIRLDLSVIDSSGSRPDLLNGTYSFSIYVRQDPTNTKGPVPVNNRMPGAAVSLTYRLMDGGTEETAANPAAAGTVAVFAPSEDSDWSSWTLLTAYFENVQVDIQTQGTGEITLELSVCPTDISLGGDNRDAGSILIASPSLVFLPDGIPEAEE